MEITRDNVKTNKGRPTKYNDTIPDKVRDYTEHFSDIDPDTVIPTMAALALYLNVNKSTLYEWMEIYPDFSDAIRELQAKAEKILVNSTLKRKFAEKFATFYSINCLGYTDKREVTANVEISRVEDFLKDAEDTEEY